MREVRGEVSESLKGKIAMRGLLRISREPDTKGRGILSSIVKSIASAPPPALRHPLMLAYRNAKKSFPTWTNVACLSEYECRQMIYYGRIRSSAWESIKKIYLEKREKTLGSVLMDTTCLNLPGEEDRPMKMVENIKEMEGVLFLPPGRELTELSWCAQRIKISL